MLIPAAGFCGSGELSLSLDALGDAVLSPSSVPSLGLGASAGLNYRFPDAPALGLGLNLGFNEFPGSTDMQTSWLDLDARFYPFEASVDGQWYLEAGVGPTLLAGLLPNHWTGQYHGMAGLGCLFPLGGNEALDLGLEYDYFNPFSNPLEDVAAKVGICWNLDEAPVQPKTRSGIAIESTPSLTPTPEPNSESVAGTSASSTPSVESTQGVVSTPGETPTAVSVQWEVDATISAKLTANIYFGYSHAKVLPKSRARMKSLAELLEKYPEDKVELSGYTDDKGEADTNQQLSLDRANSVKAVLIDGGVAENRITVLGKGMTNPLGNNETPGGRAQNRRVEIKVFRPVE